MWAPPKAPPHALGKNDPHDSLAHKDRCKRQSAGGAACDGSEELAASVRGAPTVRTKLALGIVGVLWGLLPICCPPMRSRSL